MIPLRLSMRAFGPYIEQQQIDFTALAEAGLFLIAGETGSGKTAILDAMTYALYGRSSGGSEAGNRGDIRIMRSDFAGDDEDTAVSFEFSARGGVYKFERSVSVHVKRSGEKEYRVAQNAFFRHGDGRYEPFFENPKINNVNAKAEELTGLTYEQFCRIVLLPQGQFERLLVAGSAEKEEILSTLFHAEKWQAIVENLCEMAMEMRRGNDRLEASVQSMLAGHEAADIAALHAMAEQGAARLKTLESAVKAAEKQEVKRQGAFEEASRLHRQFEEYASVTKQAEELAAQAAEIGKAQAALRKAEDARSVEPLRAAALRMNDHLKQYEAKLREAGGSAGQAKERMAKTWAAVAAHARYLESQKEELEKQVRCRQKEVTGAREAYETAFSQYIGNMAGVLADGLEDGQACPVCGSTHHPGKAALSAHETGQQDVKQAEQRLEACKNREAQAKENLAQTAREIGEFAVLADGHDAPPEAAARKGDRTALLRETEERRRAEQAAQAALDAARRARDDAGKLFDEAMEAYKAECMRYGFEDDARVKGSLMDATQEAALKERVQAHKTNVELAARRKRELEEAIAGLDAPDMERARKTLAEAQAARRTADNDYIRAKTQMEALERTVAQLEESARTLDERKQEYAELDGFAKLLRGDSGVGLKRYVLGVMLSSIAAEANRLLKLVHGGRYALYRTTEGSGRAKKVGLDLEVFDANTGERRSVSGLSGGEKFLVSLALSLGLSSVVQAQSGGIRVDAIFIDEGFGSLDPDSIGDALHMLASVRGTSRMVGIISHVQTLKETIEASIQVNKTRRGSTIGLRV